MKKRTLLFASDLDNTLLYSHRHAVPDDICVEWLDGKEQGYFSPRTIELLRTVNAHTCFIPVTTRSVAQYQRIVWPDGCAPRYAVTTNGAILLKDGIPDAAWKEELAPILTAAHDELLALCTAHESDPAYRICRMVDDAYLFLMPQEGEEHASCLQALAEETTLPIACSGKKIYILPRGLDKGQALQKLQERFQATETFAAGDSAMDLPMLRAATHAWTLPTLSADVPQAAIAPDIGTRAAAFAEWILQDVKKICENFHSGVDKESDFV